MDSLLYTLTRECLMTIGGGSGSTSTSLMLYALENSEEKALVASTALSISCAGAFGGVIDTDYKLHDVESYVQSLSQEELKQLSIELTAINDDAKLDYEMDIIAGYEEDLTAEMLDDYRKEAIIEHVNSLTIGELNDVYAEIGAMVENDDIKEELDREVEKSKKYSL